MARPQASPEDGYNVSIVAKHFEATDAIRNYVFDKLNKVDRLADRVIDVQVTLDAQKLDQSCAIMMNFDHFHIKVHGNTDNMYSAIDKCTDRLVRLVRKYKSKLQSHRFKDLSTVDIHVNVVQPLQDDLKVINEDIEAENARQTAEEMSLHQIVAKEIVKLKTLTQDEAVMKMEITGEPFLVYRSEEDKRLRVIYRRKDDNYAILVVQ